MGNGAQAIPTRRHRPPRPRRRVPNATSLLGIAQHDHNELQPPYMSYDPIVTRTALARLMVNRQDLWRRFLDGGTNLRGKGRSCLAPERAESPSAWPCCSAPARARVRRLGDRASAAHWGEC